MSEGLLGAVLPHARTLPYRHHGSAATRCTIPAANACGKA